MSDVTVPPPASRSTPEEILERSGSSFRAGFLFLSRERRAGMTAIYAFCRVADDAADDSPDPDTAAARLDYWRAELRAAEEGRPETPTGEALARAMGRFGLSAEPLEAVLDGCAMDLEPRAYATEADLRVYCDRVASAVGRACLPVLGASGPDAERLADALGQALQFTNILRDLRVDAVAGRVYAPRSWLAEYGVDPGWLSGGGPDAAYAPGGPVARLCSRFAGVAESDFAVAREALLALPLRTRRRLVPARIMGAVYRDLLRRLIARAGDLRAAAPHVSAPRKAWLASLVLIGARA